MTDRTETRLRALDTLLDGVVAQSTTPDAGLIGRIVGAVQGAPTVADLDALPEELFAVVDALESSVPLRRALTDPSTTESERQRLAHDVLDGKVSKTAVRIVVDGVAMRWAGGRTFAAALERQAIRATLMKAEREETLEDTEDELFRFARLVEGNPGLRDALSDRSRPLSNRQELVGELLAGRASDATVALAKRAVGARERTFAHTIEGFVTLAAAQKNRVVATVRVARPLGPHRRDRLRAALSRQIGREVAIQEIVEPGVLGGIRVELGDEVIEGTVAGRLQQAKRLFG
jgi:F-type H+-transporting ATPase subunit delta